VPWRSRSFAFVLSAFFVWSFTPGLFVTFASEGEAGATPVVAGAIGCGWAPNVEAAAPPVESDAFGPVRGSPAGAASGSVSVGVAPVVTVVEDVEDAEDGSCAGRLSLPPHAAARSAQVIRRVVRISVPFVSGAIRQRRLQQTARHARIPSNSGTGVGFEA
jgi:hypothetical protein